MKSQVSLQEYVEAIKEIQEAGEYPSGKVVGRRVGESRQTAERRIRTLMKLGLVQIGLPPQMSPRDEIPEAELWQRAEAVRLARPEEIEAAEARKPSDVETWVREWKEGDISRSLRWSDRYDKNSASGPEVKQVRLLAHSDRRRKGYY